MIVRRLGLFVACVTVASVATPALPLNLKAAHACSALAIHPATAINLQRPPALRYRTAPLRICVPDDTNTAWHMAFV